MTKPLSGFDWDPANRDKSRKHGVSIDEIEDLFRARPLVAPDSAHSIAEQRFIAVGRTKKDRPLFVAFTFRERDGGTLIRPVSARDMHAKEAKRYEDAKGSGSDD